MYLEYFGFSEEPFNITPNSRFLFLSERHREALAALLYGIEQRKGFIALTGEIGCGKTTICRAMLGRLDRETTRLALIFNPELSDLELLQTINAEYGIEAKSASKRELLDALYRFLLAEYENDRNVVLLIDEAQRLAPDALEQVRLISNLETEDAKLIQIALVGQPELAEILELPQLEQLNQRITVRYHIEPLTIEEIGEYVDHRLEVAEPRLPVRFHKKALRRIFEYSRGVPRRINVLSDRALLVTYVKEETEISDANVQKAIEELGGMPKRHAKRSAATAPAADATAPTASADSTAEAARRARDARRGVEVWPIAAAVLLLTIIVIIAIEKPELFSSSGQGVASSNDSSQTGGPPAQSEPPGAPGSTPSQGTFSLAALEPATPTPRPTPVPTAAPITLGDEDAEDLPPPDDDEESTGTLVTERAALASIPAQAANAPAPTPARASFPAWTYDDDGIVRVTDEWMTYPAAILTWVEHQRDFRLADSDLAALRGLPREHVAALRPAQGAPPLHLREVRLPTSLSILTEKALPVLVQVDDAARFGPWALLVAVERDVVTLHDPILGIKEVDREHLEDHLAGVVAPFIDDKGLVGLAAGTTGDAVRDLQIHLIAARVYDGEAHGEFDRQTATAVQTFRGAHYLPEGERLDEEFVFTLLRGEGVMR